MRTNNEACTVREDARRAGTKAESEPESTAERAP